MTPQPPLACPPCSTPRTLAILGSTGSIGTQTLDLVRLFPEHLKIGVLAAGKNVDLLIRQAQEFRPACVVIGDETAVPRLREALTDWPVEILCGQDGLETAGTHSDVEMIVAAVVGFAGLRSVVAGIKAGKPIALANKETLVAGGPLVQDLLREHGGELIPVDSEHSAIFQCLVGEPMAEIEQLILTASGGPFRTRDASTFATITPAEALRHPNWDMGAKITIDSATMMNKGLEVIEARWLFDLPVEQITVLIHPQSVIHSMVCFTDGSTKAQLGVPDMRVPIQYALTYPNRWPAPHPRLDWANIAALDFAPPDLEKFPCLALAFAAMAQGGLAPAVLNSANEVAVAQFLREEIRFIDIPACIERALVQVSTSEAVSLESVIATDQLTRVFVEEMKHASLF